MTVRLDPPHDPDDLDGWGSIHQPRGEPRSGGFVTVEIDGKRITAMFSAGKMELIHVLNAELVADIQNGVPPESRGWRMADDVIPLLLDPLQQPETLSRTVWAINRTFRNAAEKELPKDKIPRLIETKRDIGKRLHWPLRVEDRKRPVPP